MNREERRKLGISKETSDKLKNLNEPCTILEAVQLAQGVADDSIANYHKNINPIIVSLSIQIEVLKEMLFENKVSSDNKTKIHLLSGEEFNDKFQKRVEDYTKQRDEAINQMNEISNNKGIPKVDIVANDTEIKVSK